jgi:hypothetical protein
MTIFFMKVFNLFSNHGVQIRQYLNLFNFTLSYDNIAIYS